MLPRATSINNPDLQDNMRAVNGLFIEACREKLKGNFENSEDILKQCLKLKPASPAINFELGNIYRATGLYDAALKCTKIAAIGEPNNEFYGVAYAECLHARRMYNEAIGRYEFLLNAHPYRPEFYQGLATECLFAGKPGKAIQAYQMMEQKIGKDPEITLSIAKLYQQLKKWKMAEQLLKNAIKSDPHEVRYYSNLAEIYREQGQKELAFQTYQEILKTEPENPFVHLAIADFYRDQHSEIDFFKELYTAFGSPALDMESKIKILNSFFDVSEKKNFFHEQGIALCKLLVDSNGTDWQAQAIYAKFLYRDRDFREARRHLLLALDENQSGFVLWDQLMHCEFDLGMLDSLKFHANVAIDLFPNLPQSYLFSGLASLRLKKFNEATKPLIDGKQYVIDNLPLQVMFFSTLGEVYNGLSEFEKSDKEYEDAIAMDPNNTEVMNNYSYFLCIRKDKIDRALALAGRCAGLFPNNPSYLDTYGWVFFQKQDYQQAREWLKKAIDKGGSNRIAILEHYGDVLFKSNELEKALEYWKKSKDLGNKSNKLEMKIDTKQFIE